MTSLKITVHSYLYCFGQGTKSLRVSSQVVIIEEVREGVREVTVDGLLVSSEVHEQAASLVDVHVRAGALGEHLVGHHAPALALVVVHGRWSSCPHERSAAKLQVEELLERPRVSLSVTKVLD